MLNPLDLLRGLLEWGVQQFGLAGFGIGVGTLLTAGLWLWWGFKLRVALAAISSVARTVSKHALVSAMFTAFAIIGMLWTGIIPGFNVNAALDIGGEVVGGIFDMLAGVAG